MNAETMLELLRSLNMMIARGDEAGFDVVVAELRRECLKRQRNLIVGAILPDGGLTENHRPAQ